MESFGKYLRDAEKWPHIVYSDPNYPPTKEDQELPAPIYGVDDILNLNDELMEKIQNLTPTEKSIHG
jgi:hypothetical protein